MNVTQSLLDFILNLMRDGDAKAAFVTNPEHELAKAGLTDVCSEDVSDAMSYVSEYHPVSFVGGDRAYNVGNSEFSPHTSYRGGDDRHEGGNRPEHFDGGSHAAAVQQLEYITNNYSYDNSHNTVIDKSVNQEIWNKGDLTQSFNDNSVTATDGSVAAGRNINGDVANGNDNVVGDNNKVGNTDNSTDNSIRDSFHSSNTADNGGIAGNGNDGNVTDPYQSNVATKGGEVDSSRHIDNSSTAIDSGNTKTVTTSDNHHDSFDYTDNSISDSENGPHYEHVNDNHVQQEGLVNLNANGNEVLSHDHLPI